MLNTDDAEGEGGSASKYGIFVSAQPGSAHALSLELTGHHRKVLEVGCATGHVTKVLKSRGHVVVGVEIDPVSAEQARSVADTVHTADLDRVPLAEAVTERDFDVILMGDVLEHLARPDRVLRDSRELLRPGGHVVASLPNVAFADLRESLLEGKWNYQDVGLLDVTHRWFFTRRTVFELAERAGFVVTELHRVLKSPGTSSVAPRDPVFAPLFRELIMLDPNASTLQFVVRLEVPSPETSARADELRAGIEEEEARAERLQRQVAGPHFTSLAELQRSRETLLEWQRRPMVRIANGTRRALGRLRRLGRRR